jgi:hypothetical protein
MLWAITKKDLIDHIRSVRFWAGVLLSITLAASATLITAHDYRRRLSADTDRVTNEQRTLGDGIIVVGGAVAVAQGTVRAGGEGDRRVTGRDRSHSGPPEMLGEAPSPGGRPPAPTPLPG